MTDEVVEHVSCFGPDGECETRAVEPAPPAPLLGGTFAIYATEQGGLHMITDVEGRGVEHWPVPPALVKMMSGNSPMSKMFGKIFGAGPRPLGPMP